MENFKCSMSEGKFTDKVYLLNKIVTKIQLQLSNDAFTGCFAL